MIKICFINRLGEQWNTSNQICNQICTALSMYQSVPVGTVAGHRTPTSRGDRSPNRIWAPEPRDCTLRRHPSPLLTSFPSGSHLPRPAAALLQTRPGQDPSTSAGFSYDASPNFPWAIETRFLSLIHQKRFLINCEIVTKSNEVLQNVLLKWMS